MASMTDACILLLVKLLILKLDHLLCWLKFPFCNQLYCEQEDDFEHQYGIISQKKIASFLVFLFLVEASKNQSCEILDYVGQWHH